MGAEGITKPDTVANAHEDDEGTGIYWFIDGNGQYEQVFVPRVTRTRARELADDFRQAGKQNLDAYPCRRPDPKCEARQSGSAAREMASRSTTTEVGCAVRPLRSQGPT